MSVAAAFILVAIFVVALVAASMILLAVSIPWGGVAVSLSEEGRDLRAESRLPYLPSFSSAQF
jgi:hypothetical protein